MAVREPPFALMVTGSAETSPTMEGPAGGCLECAIKFQVVPEYADSRTRARRNYKSSASNCLQASVLTQIALRFPQRKAVPRRAEPNSCQFQWRIPAIVSRQLDRR